jgi:anhydro-N-acetylmuramic acid kinase
VKFILDHPFLKARAKGRGRSTGREDFNPAWVHSVLSRAQTDHISAPDVVASAVDAVARILNAEAIRVGADQVVLAGGGAKNATLVNAIRAGVAPAKVLVSDELGIPVDAREAIAFAVLGALSADGVPISLPQITGSVSPGVAGVWAG